MTFSQMAFSKCSSLLNECCLGNQVGERRGGKHMNHVNQVKFGMKVQSKVGCHLKSRLGRWAKVNGQQDLRRDGRGSMNVRQEGSWPSNLDGSKPILFHSYPQRMCSIGHPQTSVCVTGEWTQRRSRSL